MKAIFVGVILTIFSSQSFSAAPEDQAFKIREEGRKDENQYCYTDFQLMPNGDWTAHTKFSNGKKIDGDHYQAILIINDKDGKELVAIKHVAGMRRAHTHSAYERGVDSKGNTDKIKPENFENVTSSYECSQESNRIPDEEIANAIISAVVKLVGF